MNNDIMTLILASSILAAGGLGLYVFHSNKDERHSVRFKNDDDNDSHDDSDDDSDDKNVYLYSSNNEDKHEQTAYNEDKPSRTRSSGKTKKVRRQTKGSKRRY